MEHEEILSKTVTSDSLSDTANLLGIVVDDFVNLAISNPRVFGLLVNITVLRLNPELING